MLPLGDFLSLVTSQLGDQWPLLAVYVIGAIYAFRQRRAAPEACKQAVGACAVLFLVALGKILAWPIMIDVRMLMHLDESTYSQFLGIVTTSLSFLQATAVFALVHAVVRSRTEPKSRAPIPAILVSAPSAPVTDVIER